MARRDPILDAEERNERCLVTLDWGEMIPFTTILETGINAHNGSAEEATFNSGIGEGLALENRENGIWTCGDPRAPQAPLKTRLPRPLPPARPSASGPHGLSPRLAAPAGSDPGRGRPSGGRQGQKLAPAAPYLGVGAVRTGSER